MLTARRRLGIFPAMAITELDWCAGMATRYALEFEVQTASCSGDLSMGDVVAVHLDGRVWNFAFAIRRPSLDSASACSRGPSGDSNVTAPMPGSYREDRGSRWRIEVEERALLVVLEAMKMEHRIEASSAASGKIGLGQRRAKSCRAERRSWKWRE